MVGERKRPEYPWQIPLPAWAPGNLARLSEAERRRDECEQFFESELHLIEEGVESRLVYDPEHDVFRFPGEAGRFALSREHADWAGLKAIGYFRYWGCRRDGGQAGGGMGPATGADALAATVLIPTFREDGVLGSAYAG